MGSISLYTFFQKNLYVYSLDGLKLGMSDLSEELNGLDLGDARLNKRAHTIIDGLMMNQRPGIPGNCTGMAETQGAYRFLNNANVTPAKLLDGHAKATLARIGEHPTVLALEDTSFLSFGGKRSKAELGPHTTGKENGLNLHLCLAVTPSGWNLGLLRHQLYTKEREQGRKIDHKLRAIEQKESCRWLLGVEHCAKLSAELGGTEFVYVADRESDIYEVYKAAERNGAKWLVRGAYDRRTEEGCHLFGQADSAEEVGRIAWDLKARPGRRARVVHQSIRVARVCLKAPRRLRGGAAKWPDVEVRLVYAKEINPPEGEEPVCWMLLTNLPVENLKQAVEKVEWYRCRWQIEVYFKTLKSICGVEKLQLQSRSGLENAIGMCMLVAWRIQYLTTIARDESVASKGCDCWLEEAEWKAIHLLHHRAKPPSRAPSIREVVNMLGALGGHLGRKGDGPPGARVIAEGLNKLYQFIDNRELLQNLE